jgi:hypothetical protein
VRDRRSIYLDVLARGLLRARAAAWSGDAARAAVEADHLHNLPDLLQHLENEGLHEHYWEVSRVTHLEKIGPEDGAGFGDLWEELDAANRAARSRVG